MKNSLFFILFFLLPTLGFSKNLPEPIKCMNTVIQYEDVYLKLHPITAVKLCADTQNAELTTECWVGARKGQLLSVDSAIQLCQRACRCE